MWLIKPPSSTRIVGSSMAGEERVLVSRTQCPECFAELELVCFISREQWDTMTVQHRTGIVAMAGLDRKYARLSYDKLLRIPEEEQEALCDYHCGECGTDWPLEQRLSSTNTPIQLEIYRRSVHSDK